MSKPGPGKFEANDSLEISEYLHDISLNGWQDASLGDVEGFGFYELITNANRRVGAPQGTKAAYICHEDNNGFYTYHEFDTNDEARIIWRTDVEGAYEEFVRESDAYN